MVTSFKDGGLKTKQSSAHGSLWLELQLKVNIKAFMQMRHTSPTLVAPIDKFQEEEERSVLNKQEKEVDKLRRGQTKLVRT